MLHSFVVKVAPWRFIKLMDALTLLSIRISLTETLISVSPKSISTTISRGCPNLRVKNVYKILDKDAYKGQS